MSTLGDKWLHKFGLQNKNILLSSAVKMSLLVGNTRNCKYISFEDYLSNYYTILTAHTIVNLLY
jgi:hypothetical protein